MFTEYAIICIAQKNGMELMDAFRLTKIQRW